MQVIPVISFPSSLAPARICEPPDSRFSPKTDHHTQTFNQVSILGRPIPPSHPWGEPGVRGQMKAQPKPHARSSESIRRLQADAEACAVCREPMRGAQARQCQRPDVVLGGYGEILRPCLAQTSWSFGNQSLVMGSPFRWRDAKVLLRKFWCCGQPIFGYG